MAAAPAAPGDAPSSRRDGSTMPAAGCTGSTRTEPTTLSSTPRLTCARSAKRPGSGDGANGHGWSRAVHPGVKTSPDQTSSARRAQPPRDVVGDLVGAAVGGGDLLAE